MNNINLKIALRNFKKNKQFSLISIFGLGVGLAAFILIALYIQFEITGDKHFSNIKNIYRLDQQVHVNGNVETYSCSPFPAAPIIQQNYSEVEKACRTRFCAEFLSVDKENTFYENNGIYADSTYFEIFDYEFVMGEPNRALQEPMCVVLTEPLAEKYFPGENPIGKSLKFMSAAELKVTGVVKEQPQNATFRPRYIISFSSYPIVMDTKLDEIWDWCMINTYVMLQKNTDVAAFQSKIKDLQYEYYDNPSERTFVLWPYSKIHLQYNANNDNRPFIYLMGAVAIFILFIACINFINLSTAYSSTRIKEIGVRKVSGSDKASVIQQFLSEAVMLAFVSLFLALVLAKLFLPLLNQIINEDLQLNLIKNYPFLIFVLVITILAGMASGSYPAFVLSKVLPVNAMRNTFKTTGKKSVFRNSLVIFQFIISMILIASTFFIFMQVNHLKKEKLGFNKENLLVGYIQLTGDNNESKYEALKNELTNDPRILDVTWAHNAPFFRNEFWSVTIEGMPNDQFYRINHNHVDFDFLKTFQIKVAEGRELSEEYGTDKDGACLISQKAVKSFGWDSCGALGKKLYNDGLEYTVVGVMEDFHQYSVTRSVEPYFISYTARELSWPNSHAIRVAPYQDIAEVKSDINSKYQAYFPNDNIEFNLLDENMDERNFGFIQALGKLIGIFASIAIIIAAVGLFGLVSFITRGKTKEIGIRKSNGATIGNLIVMLNKDFVRWLIIAFGIATPITFFVMNRWLESMAIRISLAWWVFVLAGILVLFIALVTISWQSWKAASKNPVEALRYE